jgi:uncharacterized protein
MIPDLPTANRAAVRPKHIERAVPMVMGGDFYRMGGGYLSEQVTEETNDASKIPFAGSATVVVAESIEEVKKKLAEDPYTTEGVWDLSKARIWQ